MTATEDLSRGENSNARLGMRALETFSFRLAGLPLGMVITIVTSRFLLPEGRGAYALGLLTASIAATLLSNAVAITNELGRRAAPVTDVVGRGLLLDVVLGVPMAFALLPVAAGLGEGGPARLLMFGLPFLLVVQTIGGALLALGRLRLFNVVTLLDPVLTVAGLLILVVWLDYGLSGAVAAWLLAQAVAALVLLVAGRDLWLPIPRQAISLRRALPIFSLGFRAGLVNLVSLLNYRVELFLLELYRGLGAVGVYSVAMSLAELLWLLSWTIMMVLVQPAVNESDVRATEVVAQGVRHALVLTGAAGLVLAVVGSFAIPIVFGEPFRGSIVPLLILIPGAVVFSIRSPLSVYFSMRLGQMRYPLVVAGVSAIVTGLLCLVFIPRFGASGAALATTLAYTLGAVLLAAMFVRVAGAPIASMVPRPGDLLAYRSLVRTLRAQLAG